MRLSGMLAVLVASIGLTRPATAAVVWRGDLETGNTSQWSGTLNPNLMKCKLRGSQPY